MVKGQKYTFDPFGLLDGVLQMRDRQTGTVWTHLDGNAIRGPMAGQRLGMVPMPQMTWAEWQTLYPDTVVLSQETPFRSSYRPVHIGMLGRMEALYGDERLPSNTLVVGVEVEYQFKGYPLHALKKVGGLTNDSLADVPVLVFYDPVARTGMAFSRVLAGETLEFYNAAEQGLELRDRGTDSLWTRQGRSVAGPLTGGGLTFVSSFITEWYGWSAYHPETLLFPGDKS